VSKQSKRDRQRQNREQRREYEAQLERRRKTWKTVRTFAIIAVPILVIGIVVSVASGGDDSSAKKAAPVCANVSAPPKKDTSFPSPPAQTIDPTHAYTATIDTTCGAIKVALLSQAYPVSANNFVFLAQQGFYNDLAVVRAAKGFVIQAGSPTQSADGGPGYSLQGEVPKAGSPTYPKGTVAWAKTGSDPAGTIGSQFFIVTGDASKLPPDYAVLGTVESGLDVAQQIEKLAPASGDGPPTKPVVMKTVTIDQQQVVPASTLPGATPPSS
jgi:peptidyl-prolyl cis-trans isomerase B (cyclophilin B)